MRHVQDILRELEPTYGPMHATQLDSSLDRPLVIHRRGLPDVEVWLNEFDTPTPEALEQKIVAALQSVEVSWLTWEQFLAEKPDGSRCGICGDKINNRFSGQAVRRMWSAASPPLYSHIECVPCEACGLGPLDCECKGSSGAQHRA